MSSAAPAEPAADAAGRRVIVYRSSLLAPSETFVLDQVQAMQRWRPLLVGERCSSGPALPADRDVIELAQGQPAWQRRLARRWARWRNLPPAADVARLAPLRAQLLHAHFGTDGVDVAPLARALGVPLLVTLHGFDIHTRAGHWQSGAAGRGMRSYPARLAALAGLPRVGFVAVSGDVQRAALDFGIAADRITTLPIGVDVRHFAPGPLAPAQRAPVVLFVGRLVEKKGCRLLLQALASPPLRALAATLVVIGDGPLRAALQQQASTLGITAQFLGACDAAQVKRQLDQARVLCLPSITAASGDAEGFGLVLLEAQACGVPVVSSARGGSEDGLLDGVTGFAVAEGDVPAIAAALARVLGDAVLARAMSLAARDFVVARFDLARCTAALEAHYDHTVQAAA